MKFKIILSFCIIAAIGIISFAMIQDDAVAIDSDHQQEYPFFRHWCSPPAYVMHGSGIHPNKDAALYMAKQDAKSKCPYIDGPFNNEQCLFNLETRNWQCNIDMCCIPPY